ncbi:hypothetical protein C0Q70_13256 [Pomacea canaliculata]|uniref:Hexosyltransferase n=1 Tax=Pomacea canaliculata TaxID=400727 RepID=A0A2T7NWQ5_POMCA|nr:hypothetical protein C0Q70_13256 [Pomacea canaliculata]
MSDGAVARDWVVERTGKWREPDFPSSVYPTFPCGSGYVVSRNLHTWLADNARHLHSFQGEDVSMGIWLAPLAPRLIQDKRWQCFKVCEDSMLSMPDLTPAEVTSHWYNKLHCVSPCRVC